MSGTAMTTDITPDLGNGSLLNFRELLDMNDADIGRLQDIGALDSGPSGFERGLGNFSLAAQGIAGLMGAYNAFEQTEMMKDQFKASLADRNQNVANQAKTTNLALKNQAQMAAQMFGNQVGSEGFDQYIRDNQVQVDGSAIKV